MKDVIFHRLKGCVIVFFILCPAIFFAQSYMVQHYTESDGLPSSTVYDITQDLLGRIWFATRSGMACYDGLSWEKYSIADNLPSFAFFKMKVDQYGRVWSYSFISPNKVDLVYFYRGQWTKVAPSLYLPYSVKKVTSFQILEQEGFPIIVAGTDSAGVYLWKENKWTCITEDNGLSGNEVYGIALLGEKIIAATNKGLSVIQAAGDIQLDRAWNEKLGLSSKKIYGIAVEYKNKFSDSVLKQNRVWLCGMDWLGYFDEDALKMVFVLQNSQIFSDRAVEQILLQPDYRCGIYVGHHYELRYYNILRSRWEVLDIQNGLIGGGANSLFIDFEKNLWVGCDRGVSKIWSRRFGNFQMMHGLLEDEVSAVLEYEPGKFILGHNKGFTYYDGRQFRKLPMNDVKGVNSPSFRVLDIKMDSRKTIWSVIGLGGLLKFNPGKQPVVYGPKDGLWGDAISLWCDNRDRVWVGTLNGLYYLTPSGTVIKSGWDFDGIYLRRLYGDPVTKQLMYIGTATHGLLWYKEGYWKTYRAEGNEKANGVYSILKDSRGRLLMGTLDGVYTVKNDNYIKFSEKNFILHRPVFFIVEDNKKRLWLGTDNGVVMWDGNRSRAFSMPEGLIGNETNRAAGILDSIGRIWIGTNRGVSVYDGAFDNSPAFNPTPKIRLISVETPFRRFPLELNPTQRIQVGYVENTLDFRFRGISFENERLIRFKSWLEGLEINWSDEGYPYNQVIRYTNLSPGKYRFHIKARNVMDTWSKEIVSPWITVSGPFYRQWWFLLLVIMGIGGLLYSIFQYIMQLRQAANLKKMVEERTRDLQIAEQRYRRLFEDIRDVVFISTPEGTLLDVNPVGLEMFGYDSNDELLKDNRVFVLYENPSDREAFRREIEENGFVKDFEVVMKRKNGEKLMGQITASVERDKDGNISAYRGIIRDVTEKKRLEEQLMQAQKMEAIGTLAGGIAHDFNNILGVILGYTELVLEDLPAGTQLRQNVESIYTAASRAAELVKQILAFSRQGNRTRQPIRLTPVIQESLKLLRSILPSTITIHRAFRTVSDFALADGSQIHQIMMNLCSNAAHAMQEKGGILEISLDEISIAPAADSKGTNLKPGHYLKLSVKDTGYGMSEPILKRIFEPYFTTKKPGEGTGMGLAVIHGIVKIHGGEITVHSEPGKGSIFNVYLPKMDEEAASEAIVYAEIVGGNECILLVDDETSLIQVGTLMLERLGYKVVGKSDPLEALDVFRKEPALYDLVISDVTMPNMTGVRLSRELREIKPGIPVILCSGFSSAINRDQLIEFGVNEFVMKPIIKNDLARVVRRVIDESRKLS